MARRQHVPVPQGDLSRSANVQKQKDDIVQGQEYSPVAASAENIAEFRHTAES